MSYKVAARTFDHDHFQDRHSTEPRTEHEQVRLTWTQCPEMQAVDWMIDKVADNDVTALIRGESGVGKELVARAIHQRSPRWKRPYVKVNCAALPAELLESELFGHERGAFTGAVATRVGKFEVADTGTLFLDEVGELSAALQAKLLHVVQDSQFSRLGSNQVVSVNTRLIAATNRDLEDMMARREFREDLFYRLKVIEITVPPLRNRRADIPHLCRQFIKRYARQYHRPERELSRELLTVFYDYEWPGNIRELENMIKRIVILQDEQIVIRDITQAKRTIAMAAVTRAAAPARAELPAEPQHPAAAAPEERAMPSDDTLSPASASSDDREDAVEEPSVPTKLADLGKAAALEAERQAIERVLEQTHWNRKRAAQQLGASYKTLLNRIKQCGISRD